MKWPEWLVFGISFLVLAIISFIARSMGDFLGIEAGDQKYLMFGAFFGVIFVILSLASFINLIITATRHHVEKVGKFKK